MTVIKESVSKYEECKVLCDGNIQCDHIIEAGRPNIVEAERKGKKCIIINITGPGDNRIREKE